MEACKLVSLDAGAVADGNLTQYAKPARHGHFCGTRGKVYKGTVLPHVSHMPQVIRPNMPKTARQTTCFLPVVHEETF